MNDYHLPPHLLDVFSQFGFNQSIFIRDIQESIDLVEAEQLAARANAPSEFFDAFRTTPEVMAWINDLKAKYPELVTTTEIGKTIQGKPIVAVHVQSAKGPKDKIRIVYNSGQHAREWITITTLNYILNEFLTNYGVNATFTKLIDEIDWTFVPILNVDGYDYTFSNDRMWRKNRKLNPGGCYGVDNNRNWPYQWNRGGTSTNPCSEIFHGPGPGTEPENMAIANYIFQNRQKVKGYIDIHSYSQLWMSPYGWTNSYPPDYTQIREMMLSIVSMIRSVHGVPYTAGSIANTIYIASGSSADYVYSIGVKYSFAVELRDTGRYGFIMPPSQIIPQGEEILEAVVVMGDAILAEQRNSGR